MASLSLLPMRAPSSPPALEALAAPEGCRFGPAGSAPPCPCERLSGRQRRLLGLPIPLNRAGPLDLEVVPGIGSSRAAAIVRDRERLGAFQQVADLERVPGIGPATVERIRPFVLAAGPDPACARAPHR
jgi:competence ComEA-like helix-hairpin-helix protein